MNLQIDEFRPIPFYFLNTVDAESYTPAEALKSMRKLKEAGFGGALLFNKPPTGFSQDSFLAEPWFNAIGSFLTAARELDMKIWINDGWNYPPGDAGGRIEAVNPELFQQRLERKENGTVEVVKCDWGFPSFEEPESSSLFLRFVHEEYFRRFREYFGTTLAGFFSDADNRRINARAAKLFSGKVYFPWCHGFAEGFRQKYGYDIKPFLPQITDLADIPQAGDYWEYCSDLYGDWFRKNHEWCKAHNVKYSFHTSDTGPLSSKDCRRSSVFAEGITMKLAANCDYPGTDHELLSLDGGTHFDSRYFVPDAFYGGEVHQRRRNAFADTLKDIRAKLVSSTAVMTGADRTLCEMFAATNWGADGDDLRRIACWQIMQGVNFIIPHAVHHRFFGTTKYFAPPEFFQAFPLKALRKLNDFLAKYSAVSAMGKYIPEVAVLDPSRRMWQTDDCGKFFELCDRLNRENLNYIIVQPEDSASLPCPVIDPLAPPESWRLPEPQVRFSGGTIGTMIRTLDDGTQMLLAANIWSDEILSGTLEFDGRRENVELAPGEIAVFNGPCEEFRTPLRPASTEKLAGGFDVVWKNENLIPCHFSKITLEYDAPVKAKILIPAECTSFSIPEISGPGREVMVFDDPYREWELPADGKELHLDLPELSWDVPVYITGDFDVEILSDEPQTVKRRVYAIKLHAPDSAVFRLSQRRRVIAPGSWADQGQPFYSGAADCSFEMDFSGREADLYLPGFRGVAGISIDGTENGDVQIFPPFRFKLGSLNGKHTVTLHLCNTMANMMECYKAEGGLLQPPVIEYMD